MRYDYDCDEDYDQSVAVYTGSRPSTSHNNGQVNYCYEDEHYVVNSNHHQQQPQRCWLKREPPIGAPTAMRLVETTRYIPDNSDDFKPRTQRRLLSPTRREEPAPDINRNVIVSPAARRLNDASKSPRPQEVLAQPIRRSYSVVVPPSHEEDEPLHSHPPPGIPRRSSTTVLSNTYRRNPEPLTPPSQRRNTTIAHRYEDILPPQTPKKSSFMLIDFTTPKKCPPQTCQRQDTCLSSASKGPNVTPRKNAKLISPLTTPNKNIPSPHRRQQEQRYARGQESPLKSTAVIYPNKTPAPVTVSASSRSPCASPTKSLKASWITLPTTYVEPPTATLCYGRIEEGVWISVTVYVCVQYSGDTYYKAQVCPQPDSPRTYAALNREKDKHDWSKVSSQWTGLTGISGLNLGWEGRRYFLDLGLLSGFTSLLLGGAGFRARASQWLPNRNYISGYILLTIFSMLSSAGLVILSTLRPKPGTALADMIGGAICGVSGLSLLLAGLGVVASQCCKYPPPDNRVQHCAEGFVV
uniref:Uncharacterized protein n=1 Tax=Timema douglasi TaxID=61478 RepID=A0A7R8VK35_TIMDO|nr:unnamed protein product [Timema douglasi]